MSDCHINSKNFQKMLKFIKNRVVMKKSGRRPSKKNPIFFTMSKTMSESSRNARIFEIRDTFFQIFPYAITFFPTSTGHSAATFAPIALKSVL